MAVAKLRAEAGLDYFELVPDETGDALNSAVGVTVPSRFYLRLAREGLIELDAPLRWLWRNPDRTPPDFVRTVDVVRLVSEQVKEIYEAHLGAADAVQWLPAILELPDGSEAAHWVPHFPIHHDVLSDRGTTWGVNGVPMRYAYSRAKLEGHAVTTYAERPSVVPLPDGSTASIPSMSSVRTQVIAAVVADSLRDAATTGARVFPAPLDV